MDARFDRRSASAPRLSRACRRCNPPPPQARRAYACQESRSGSARAGIPCESGATGTRHGRPGRGRFAGGLAGCRCRSSGGHPRIQSARPAVASLVRSGRHIRPHRATRRSARGAAGVARGAAPKPTDGRRSRIGGGPGDDLGGRRLGPVHDGGTALRGWRLSSRSR